VKRSAHAFLLLLIACSTRATGRTVPGAEGASSDARGANIRVALVNVAPVISATEEFNWFESDGVTLLARGRRGEHWRVERHGGESRVRALRPDGTATSWQRSIVMRASAAGVVTVGGKRFRGDLLVTPLGDSLAIVNRVPLEDYLRSVVAVEMGNRPNSDIAALQAQAVAARSYAVLRLGGERPFDVYGSVQDQAYGGLDAENARASDAVSATRGLVLRYEGRVVDAPYSSTCGGTTAAAPEVWRNRGAPYLQQVSDRVGQTARYYCDVAPRYRWTRTMSRSELDAALARYLRAYAPVPAAGPGKARKLDVVERTPSGRSGVLEIETDRATFALRGNEIRYVMRSTGGEILNSTYFSVESRHDDAGFIDEVTFRGQGYGHGIGMCQWGAIGRSRAGQSFRTILATYYPGTSVGPVQ
jgi:stage II sporulation protein D